MSEELVKAIAKKYNIPEEDAKLALAIISSFDDASQLEKAIGSIASTLDAVSKASPQTQQTLQPLIQMALARQLIADPLQRQIASMISGLATVKWLFGSDQQVNSIVQTLAEQLKALNERISKLEEAKTREEFQQLVDVINQYVETINKQIQVLNERINQLSNGGGQADDLVRAANTIKNYMEAFRALGFKIVRPGEEPTIDEIAKYKEHLEKLGYEVKPRTLTPEEVERMLRERDLKWKQRMKKLLKRYEKVKEAEARKTEAIAAIVAEILATARAFLAKSSGTGAEELVELAEKRLASASTQQSAEQSSESEQGTQA